MSVKMTHCAFATGHLEGGDFGPACHPGDWALFSGIFSTGPEPIFGEAPRVFVTPVLEDPIDIGAFPVCVIREVSATEFTLAARNMAVHGFAAFNWLAVRETPGVVQQVPDVSTGVLPTLFFGPEGGPSAQAGTSFLPQLNTGEAAVLLTATDQNVPGHSVPGVGALRDDFLEGVGKATALTAHNSDCVGGACAFNWVRVPFDALFVPEGVPGQSAMEDQGAPAGSAETTRPELSIETGEVAVAAFQPSGQPGDWQIWDIRFTDSFADAPVVLVTANKAEATPSEANPAVVGVVQAVTRHGFRLAARNTDCGAGEAGFCWIALGLPFLRRSTVGMEKITLEKLVELLQTEGPKGLGLANVDLTGMDLSESNFDGLDFSGLDLSGGDFREASLVGAKCIETVFFEANFTGAFLCSADLSGADLVNASLRQADLSFADLTGAILRHLSDTGSLRSTMVVHADLSGADLSGADLSGAQVSNEQLAAAAALKETTLPDGARHHGIKYP